MPHPGFVGEAESPRDSALDGHRTSNPQSLRALEPAILVARPRMCGALTF
jgi:hypothetical protein